MSKKATGQKKAAKPKAKPTKRTVAWDTDSVSEERPPRKSRR